MNRPPYIIVDVFTDIVSRVSTAINTEIGKTVAFHYGSVLELNETLQQEGDSSRKYLNKFPAIWLAQPFTVTEGNGAGFGKVDELRLFILTRSNREWKAAARMTNNYKPILYPIVAELKSQIFEAAEFIAIPTKLSIKQTDWYWWGESDKAVLNDVVDIIELKISNLIINNNLNC
jgi:hypothetical protein